MIPAPARSTASSGGPVRSLLDGTSASQRGVLLSEFLVAAALAAIVGAVLVGALFQVNRAGADGGHRLEVTTNVRTATLWLARDVHSARTTTVPDGGGTAETATFEWTDGSGDQACSYALSAGNLVRTCNGTPSVAARGVSGLQFSRTGGLITITFTISAPGRPDINETVHLNLALRNG